MATLGDPLIDLGTLLAYWPDSGDVDSKYRVVFQGLESLGLPSRQVLVDHYAEQTGLEIADVSWYEAFGLWKTAIVSQQLYDRHVNGETSDERLARRNEYVVPLAEAALKILQ
jgi:aminoglycoside phosphotransferase (APT) family kinase protein